MKICLTITCLLFASISFSQSIASKKLESAVITFFNGKWTGAGAFASGKKIAADLSFEISLDSCWLVGKHTDQLPNKYNALSVWGVDRNGAFVAYIFDNFQGHRKFTSNGWNNNKIILTTDEFYPAAGTVYEHFIYEKLSDSSFKMTYETSKDCMVWKMGDYLVFTRQ